MNSPSHRYFNLAVVVGPPVGLLVAIVVLWNRLVSVTDIVILLFMYGLAGVGLTVGYHRQLSHRSFETPRWLKLTFAVMGSMAGQGPPIVWVADHRKHHAFADEQGDPHSPHLHGPGIPGALRGLWHAYMGWLLDLGRRSEPVRYAPDLIRDVAMRRISALFFWLLGLGLAIPFGLGYAATGRLGGALAAMAWGGPIRLLLSYHATFTVNSLGHFLGSRPFRTADESRNMAWFALFSLGDSWHNNHHAFPRSARHGIRAWQIDPSGMLIAVLERAGLARNVVAAPPAKLEGKRRRTGAATPNLRGS